MTFYSLDGTQTIAIEEIEIKPEFEEIEEIEVESDDEPQLTFEKISQRRKKKMISSKRSSVYFETGNVVCQTCDKKLRRDDAEVEIIPNDLRALPRFKCKKCQQYVKYKCSRCNTLYSNRFKLRSHNRCK